MRFPGGFQQMKALDGSEKNLTAAYTMDAEKDNGVCFTNTGATGAVAITLPSATVGLVVRARTTAAQTLELDPADADTITNIGAVAATAGKHIISNGDGNEHLEMTCYVAGAWVVTKQFGTWAIET